MSSNFDYPFQRGTESLPTEPNQRLGGVRPSGNEVNDEYYEEVVQRNSALIDMFTRQSRQEANLSGLDSYYNSGQYPEFDITYIRQFGKEHVNVSPKPERPEEDKKKPEPEIIEDIMLDGYIGVIYTVPNVIGFPTIIQTDHVVSFNKVWVYVPDYTPPGGYTPNFDFLTEVPSYDGVTYGIMNFNVWYPGAKLEWVVYDPSSELKWVGPTNKEYVLDSAGLNFPHVHSPLTGQDYNIFVKISEFVNQFYKLTTGTQPVPAIGPEFFGHVPITVDLNGTTILNYTAGKSETKCFIFRFGKDACRSHSYRDQITEDFGLELLNPVIPPRPDPNKVFKELLPANCGLDPNFWHGHFQLYENYTGDGTIPVEVIDMGIFSRELIIEGLNRVTASYGNPPQSTTYFIPGTQSQFDRNVEEADPVGQLSIFAEFFSRNPKDFRLVDQSWHNPFKENVQYRVNDLPKYYFPNANIYDAAITNNQITDFANTKLQSGINATPEITLTSQEDSLENKRYLFNCKKPISFDIGQSGVVTRPSRLFNYSEFSFEFDLSSDAPNILPATQNLPDGYGETWTFFPDTNAETIQGAFPNTITPTIFRTNVYNFSNQKTPPSPFGFTQLTSDLDMFGEMSQNIWGVFGSNPWDVTTYWFKPEVENGISDWLLFVRSLMAPYIINGDTSIAGLQEEEKFLKE